MIKNNSARSASPLQVRSAGPLVAGIIFTLFTLFLSIVSAPGAYSQGGALDQLSSGGGSISLPVPGWSPPAADDSSAPSRAEPENIRLPEKSSASRESERIIRMSPEALASATPDQKIQMLNTLIRDSRPNDNNNSGGNNWDQEKIEKAILRVLDSAPDAASFDYIYYRLKKDSLEYAAGWYKDIEDRLKAHRQSVVPGDWDALRQYVDTVSLSEHSGLNLIKFLIDGKDVMAEVAAALKSAEKSIHIQVFQLQADHIGQAIADLLSAKAKAGLTVRLMIDEYGSQAKHDEALKIMLDSMRSNGIQVIVQKAPFMKKHLDHRKVMVIDGKVGFTGGMNIGRLYQVEWHDQQTLIEGPAVAKLQEAFVERWKAAGGGVGADEDLFPAIEEYPGGARTQVIQHIGLRDQNIKAMYLRAIGTAQISIKIANPYFTDEDVVSALRKAARRGVKVQLVLPQDNDVPIVQHASRHYYPKLVKAGVEVYEYKGRMAHEKVAVFDGRWSTFGSSNLDARSLINNDELNLIITDPRIAEDIETRLFDADLPNCELMNNYSPSLLDHMAHMVNGLL